ncbi:hypothetical protein NC652_040395 [Populus alba x Populus x berolinensis]|nr:hypothetical protein NC652_040395 [Populus alba x Populus x berolinensis]
MKTYAPSAIVPVKLKIIFFSLFSVLDLVE